MKTASDDVRESAQLLDGERLNFGLVQVVYEWARAKVSHGKKDGNRHFILSDL